MISFDKKKCPFPKFPSFGFDSILEIIYLGSLGLLQIFIVVIALSKGKFKTFIEFQINRPQRNKDNYIKRILFMHITFS